MLLVPCCLSVFFLLFSIGEHFDFLIYPWIVLYNRQVVYVARNPKDVLVSYFHYHRLIHFHQFTGDLESFADYFMSDKGMALLLCPVWCCYFGYSPLMPRAKAERSFFLLVCFFKKGMNFVFWQFTLRRFFLTCWTPGANAITQICFSFSTKIWNR